MVLYHGLGQHSVCWSCIGANVNHYRGAAHPTENPYSWTNLSHTLWVEQPVGTGTVLPHTWRQLLMTLAGFSQGEPSITNDDELAEQLVGFFNQFLYVLLRGMAALD